jgi:hypothetical protein
MSEGNSHAVVDDDGSADGCVAQKPVRNARLGREVKRWTYRGRFHLRGGRQVVVVEGAAADDDNEHCARLG